MAKKNRMPEGIDFATLRNRRTAKLVKLIQREGLGSLYLNGIENVRYSVDLRPVVDMWFQNS
jgi:hypothetical protein